MKNLRVAVIGCGVIRPLHLECYKPLDFVDIAWVCDLIPERAKGAAETLRTVFDIYDSARLHIFR